MSPPYLTALGKNRPEPDLQQHFTDSNLAAKRCMHCLAGHTTASPYASGNKRNLASLFCRQLNSATPQHRMNHHRAWPDSGV